jgi:hypothetical protein
MARWWVTNSRQAGIPASPDHYLLENEADDNLSTASLCSCMKAVIATRCHGAGLGVGLGARKAVGAGLGARKVTVFCCMREV